MSESARRLKVNRVLAGKPCGACGSELAFGADGAVCTVCQGAHHAACWDKAGGCSTAGCANAPLQQIPGAPPLPAEPMPAGTVACPHCGAAHAASRVICPKCKRAPSPSGVYSGPKENAPGAVAALVWGLVSLLLCGIITGVLAIQKANQAHKAIEANPRYGGAGMATAGKVLGFIGIIGSAIFILTRFMK